VQESIKLLVVLLEAEELSSNVRDWPKSISLAVCLLPTGEHHFVVFHVDEFPKICPRLERQLGLSKDEFEIYPEVEGYNSRTMLFSETQLIWSLVAQTQEVLEEAVDYSENYRFAKEEGLDPTLFLGLEPSVAQVYGGEYQKAAEFHGAMETAAHQGTSVIQFVSHRACEKRKANVDGLPSSGIAKAQLPSFLLPHQARPIPSYMNACELEAPEHAPNSWTVHPEKDGWIIVERLSQGDIDLQVEQQNQIFLQKNRQKLAVRLAAGPGQQPKMPSRIRFKADLLPPSIQRAMSTQSNLVSFSQLGYFLYLLIERASSASEVGAMPMATLRCDPDPQPLSLSNRNTIFPALSSRISKPFVRKKGVRVVMGVASLVLIGFAAVYISDDAQAGGQVENRLDAQQLSSSDQSGLLQYFKNFIQ